MTVRKYKVDMSFSTSNPADMGIIKHHHYCFIIIIIFIIFRQKWQWELWNSIPMWARLEQSLPLKPKSSLKKIRASVWTSCSSFLDAFKFSVCVAGFGHYCLQYFYECLYPLHALPMEECSEKKSKFDDFKLSKLDDLKLR